ncbi:hypothetical protein PR048_032652 [Dryococelus australis]|uniref:Uncharacterized protein n=1 Tax=Dryococelus australis TaxID=614101 RepID=A0ABQ9G709_9NEOP|nr:hypothetical protein PR048_032652 [Dryococelus australis]
MRERELGRSYITRAEVSGIAQVRSGAGPRSPPGAPGFQTLHIVAEVCTMCPIGPKLRNSCHIEKSFPAAILVSPAYVYPGQLSTSRGCRPFGGQHLAGNYNLNGLEIAANYAYKLTWGIFDPVGSCVTRDPIVREALMPHHRFQLCPVEPTSSLIRDRIIFNCAGLSGREANCSVLADVVRSGYFRDRLHWGFVNTAGRQRRSFDDVVEATRSQSCRTYVVDILIAGLFSGRCPGRGFFQWSIFWSQVLSEVDILVAGPFRAFNWLLLRALSVYSTEQASAHLATLYHTPPFHTNIRGRRKLKESTRAMNPVLEPLPHDKQSPHSWSVEGVGRYDIVRPPFQKPSVDSVHHRAPLLIGADGSCAKCANFLDVFPLGAGRCVETVLDRALPTINIAATEPPSHRYGRLLIARSSEPMRAIEVNMEQLRNGRVGETGDSRENPPTDVTIPTCEPGSPWWVASDLTARPPWPPG